MYPIKITLLTPIHIGSGVNLESLTSYVHFPGEQKIVLIDEYKIYQLFQNKQSDMEDWIRQINDKAHNKTLSKGAFLEWIKLKAGRKNIQLTDVGNTIIDYRPSSDNKSTTTQVLKTALRSGNGRILLPGSSIKGSLRTAFFTNSLPKTLSRVDWTDERSKFSGKALEKRIFSPETKKISDSPNYDVFRFVRFSDFHFDHSEAYICRVFSNYDADVQDRKDLDNILECIPSGQIAYGTLQIPKNQIHLNTKYSIINEEANKRIDIYKLFKESNDYLLNQLDLEKERFKNANDPVDSFLIELNDIAEKIKKLDSNNQCILRIGAGSGFLFTTGGWQEKLMPETERRKLAFDVRHGRNKNDKLPFPRSRKYISGSTSLPLGFVLLELLDPELWKEEQRAVELRRAQIDAEIRAEQQRDLERIEKEEKERAQKEKERDVLEPLTNPVRSNDEVDVRILESVPGKPRSTHVEMMDNKGNVKRGIMSGYNATPDEYGKVAIAKVQKVDGMTRIPELLNFVRFK